MPAVSITRVCPAARMASGAAASSVVVTWSPVIVPEPYRFVPTKRAARIPTSAISG
jgi:hypothetical protein